MIFRSSSLERPVFTSASTPRCLKMSMAAGESLSAMSTRGMGFSRSFCPLIPAKAGTQMEQLRCRPWGRGADPVRSEYEIWVPAFAGMSGNGGLGGGQLGNGGLEGPVEPGGERLQVGAVHRGAAPDAQAGRRVA